MSETTLAFQQLDLLQLSLQREIEEYLCHEAELADGHRYKDWLALWAPELLYWVPCNADNIDPQRQVSLIYDDRGRLEERLFRLQTKHAHSQNPRSRLSRTVSNVRLRGENAQGQIEVHSRFHLVEARLDHMTTWAGRQLHVLGRHADGWRIHQKKVLLVNNDSLMGNMTFVI
ncbi:aromatic-ring-hydroxylating dioxygenase subunit beta [Cupriavidus necator]|uniref:aromatic-ring-hydroxylating dioxygenase subunit beta n=1 Tax=Cupriavidus necator TaxID=106590 RepID=UPI00068B3440|nr:aromatic-ring-hydroxylating dioxygenase subunit beta [Cupriavidus necator]